jgi:RNA polymerase sigma factor (sigma-70 family)
VIDWAALLSPEPNCNVTAMDRLTRCFLEARNDLLRFLAGRTGHATAEDIVQDAWIKLREHGDATSWHETRAVLFTTAANLATDTQRREARAVRSVGYELSEVDLSCSRCDPQEQVDATEQLERLAAALEQLPPLCREAFLLYRLDALTHREIAARLGVSKKSVQRYIERAFRHCLEAARP